MTDNEMRVLLRRIEQLEREVVQLRARVGNMPVRIGGGGGGGGAEPEGFGIYQTYLPVPSEAWGEYGEGLGKLAYLRDRKAFYRLVEGPAWAAVTVPRMGAWADGVTSARTGIRAGEIYSRSGEHGDDLYFHYGTDPTDTYPDAAGCISSILLPGAAEE